MERRAFVQFLGAGGLLTGTGCLGGPTSSGSSSTRRGDRPSSSASSPCTASAQGSDQWWHADADTCATGSTPATTPSNPETTAWTVTLPRQESPTRCVIGRDRVYTGIRSFDTTPATSKLVARALDDGSVDWTVDLPYSGVAPPALGPGPDDVALFVASSQDHSNTGPGKGTVRALDPRTGDQHWEWRGGSELGGLVVTDNRVVVTTVALDTVAVHVLDATDGTRRWSHAADGWLHNTPTVHDGVVYFSVSRTALAAVALDDKSTLWTTPTRADDTRPVVDPSRNLVYVGHGRGLEAFHLSDGSRAWEFIATPAGTPEEAHLGVIDEPVVLADQLVLRTSDTSGHDIGDVGYCYGLDPETGTQAWKRSARRPASSFVGAGDYALVRLADSAAAVSPPWSNQGRDASALSLVAIDAEGSIAWVDSAPWRPQAVGAGRLFCYRGSVNSDAETVTIGCLPIE